MSAARSRPGARHGGRLAVASARHFLLCAACLVVLGPVGYVVIASLKDVPDIFGNPYGLPTDWAWHNYVDAWHEAQLSLKLTNSVVVTGVSVLASTFLAALASYGLSRRERPLAMVLYTVFVSGMLIPVQMTVLPLFVLLRDIGILSTLGAMILPYIAMGLPLGVLILTPLIATLPRELGDAARMDGATEWQIFLSIVLPMIRPGLASVVILNGVWMWNEFFIPLVLAIQPTTQTLPVGIMSFVGTYSTEWGLIFASVVMATAPAVIAYVAMSRQFVEGLTAGAVKG
ncbi:MAG: carbohydrate ABC transporter permease [Acidisphaera sp.]|nr:carbohydrate ABC transporter permease [Acidisphaera sp.]MBV9812894.1 carbohydrate ABC transporter permease [Acetobacteraceae bacterium]